MELWYFCRKLLDNYPKLSEGWFYHARKEHDR
jgi:hypothetical protein